MVTVKGYDAGQYLIFDGASLKIQKKVTVIVQEALFTS